MKPATHSISNAQVSVLSTKDRDAWVALLEQLPPQLRDLHYHPDYFSIYEKSYGTPAQLFVWQSGGATIFQPFIRRDMKTLPVKGEGLSDIESVYGYGGPLPVGTVTPALAEAYQRDFTSWCQSQDYVSEFCLLHPFFTDTQKTLTDGLELTHRKDVVYVDLREPLSTLWARMEQRQHRVLRTARKRGVAIERAEPTDAALAAFNAMYKETMQRVGATENWYHPEDYYHHCRDCLGAENVSLLHAKVNGEIAAAIFLLHRYDTVYYHFVASNPEFKDYHGPSLLIFDSMMWAKAQGFRFYHMGGGRTTGQDSLFTFKNAFANRTAPLYAYKRVLLPEAYEQLAQQKIALEMAELGAAKESNFFPMYRR